MSEIEKKVSPLPMSPVRPGSPTSSGGPQLEDFIMEKEIGEGSYSRVFRALYTPMNRKFAIKILQKLRVLKENKVNEVKMEKQVLQILNHHFIVKLFFLDFALELAPGGDLFEYLHKYGKFKLPVVIFYSAEILVGVEYMHTVAGVIHRDLKPENILLSRDSHIKLTDFGTATLISESKEAFVGTAQYLSPEVIEGKPCTSKSDLWALGCIIYQLLTNTHAFDAPSEYLIMKKILSGHVEYPDWFPLVAKDLISKLLQQKPEDRPNHKEIREHPFFCGVNFEHLHEMIPPPLCPTEVEQELIDVPPEEVLELDEHCLYTTWVSKKKSLMIKSRQLMITENRIILVNPFKKQVKNSMDWSREIHITKRNEYELVLSNGKEHWLVEDFKDCDKLFKKILEYKKLYQ